MTRTILNKIAILILAAVLTLHPASPASAARFEELRISNLGNDLVVYLKVKDAFNKDMREAVMSGVETTFFFLIALNKVRNFFPDKTVANVTLIHSVKYHSLRDEFTVRRSWEDNEPVVVKTFKEAQERMSEIDNIDLIPLNMLKKGERYQLQAKAEMGKVTLPFYLHYVLFFVSLWDFETDWHTIDFTY